MIIRISMMTIIFATIVQITLSPSIIIDSLTLLI